MIHRNENLDDGNKTELSELVKKFNENQKKYSYEDKTDNSDKYLT